MVSQAEQTQYVVVIFGGLAVMVTLFVTVDPWLCVAGFHRVCLCRMSFYNLHYSTDYCRIPYSIVATRFYFATMQAHTRIQNIT